MKSSFLKLLMFFFAGWGIVKPSLAQTTYHIYFINKNGSEYNPYEFLHPKAIERRIIHGLDLCDTSDFPVNEYYLKEVAQLADSLKGISRWMNAIFINASYQNISKIQKFPFVKSIEKHEQINGNIICELDSETNSPDFDTTLSDKKKKLVTAQLERMNSKILKDSGLDGRGVRIAIIDVGFKTYTTNPAFEHIRQRKGIIGTYDFVKKQTNTNTGMMHGTNVFSCIAGKVGPYEIGLAQGAEFLLARTEKITEFFNEEQNWLLAAEWADKNGADIINSSLGYTTQRYLPEDMDGKTAFVSRAAQLAVDKGILVVSAAGNEGDGKWKRVAAPGDAAGVLTVGGIDPSTGIHIDFSSYGPSWDKRLKPEVCAYGKAIVAGRNGLDISEGTSFSSPLVAGFAACLKQRYPTITNVQLKELICRSGDLWPYYDYAHGYGVPQPFFLFKDTIIDNPTVSIIEDKDDITLYPIEWDTALKKTDTLAKTEDTTNFLLDKILHLDSLKTDSLVSKLKNLVKENIFSNSTYKISTAPFLFYHIKNKKGYIDKYYVMDMEDDVNGSVSISKNITDKPFFIEFYYRGYYKEIIINE